MSHEVKLPELGEQIEGGDVVAIRVKVGDRVEVDDVLVELETDKAVVEVPATAAGVVQTIHVKQGDTVQVGQTIVTLDAADGAAAAEKPAATKADAGARSDADTKDTSDSDDASDSAEQDDDADERGEANSTPQAPPQRRAPTQSGSHLKAVPGADRGPSEPVAAAPSVRKLARELGVDIQDVPAGDDGRIHADDVKAFARSQLSAVPDGAVNGGDITPAPPPATAQDDERRESMSKVRRATAKQMTLAWNTIPHVTHYDEADVTDLERQRKAVAAEVEEAGGKLTPTAILLKLLGTELKAHPKLTASIDVDNDEIVYRNTIHVGVAVDTPRGLLVPVIRDVDRKSLVDLAVELQQMSARARTGKVALAELHGAVFTVTNLGGIGGTGFSPLINPPEVAILGVSRSRIQPLFIDGEFVPRLVMPFSLSYDHRLIDGADAARFCRDLADALETPLRLLVRNSQ